MWPVCEQLGMWLKTRVPFLSFNSALIGGNDGVPNASDLCPSDSSPSPQSPRGIEARHEVQRRVAAESFREPSPNVSPREAELSYYELEHLYSRSDASVDGQEEVKDERVWPSAGGKFSMYGSDADPRPTDVYDEIERKHRARERMNASWPFAGLFSRLSLRGQHREENPWKERSMNLYIRSKAFDLIRSKNLCSVDANYIKKVSIAEPKRLIGYQICLLYPEDVSDMEEESDSPYCHGDGKSYKDAGHDLGRGRLPILSYRVGDKDYAVGTLEDSDLVHGNNAPIVPPLPSISLTSSGKVSKPLLARHRNSPEARAMMFEALSSKEAIDESVCSFKDRIRLVVDTVKLRDPYSHKNRTHFVLVKANGDVETVPLRRSADKTGYHFTVLRRVKLVEAEAEAEAEAETETREEKAACERCHDREKFK